MRAITLLSFLTAISLGQAASVAHACGGFFCSTAPVDQAAERVVFTVHDDSTDMVVQITYEGDDEDFAWVIPLTDVPDPESLETVPLPALLALDQATRPQFNMHEDCPGPSAPASSGIGCGAGDSAVALSAPGKDEGVDVFFEQRVGPYVAVAIGSDDPQAAASWLRDNGYNIAPAMDPYIELYTAQEMKFLALRLSADSTVGDIQPFKLTLPGQSPGIPLRLTSIAAEPEMNLFVWVFADQRYQPANAEEFVVDPEQLRWQPFSFGQVTNYRALVARDVDAREGHAWAVDMADETMDTAEDAQNRVFTEEDEAAIEAMVSDSAYVTRLSTALSPAEMDYDPLFRRSKRDDIPRTRDLPYVESLCHGEDPPPPNPCHFASCGELGLCRQVEDAAGNLVAACACAPGAAARTKSTSSGTTTVSCVDERLSFLNPGERTDEDAAPFGNPCANFDCGEHGACVSMNLTPTCECEEGFVARVDNGGSEVRCVDPLSPVPELLYQLRPSPRDKSLPVGREVALPDPNTKLDNAEIRAALLDLEGTPADPQVGGGCSSRRWTRSHSSWLLPLLGSLYLWHRRRPWVR